MKSSESRIRQRRSRSWTLRHDMATEFIRPSSFLVLATADRDVYPDVSPKGDEPGLVIVEAPSTSDDLIEADDKHGLQVASARNV